MRGSVYSLEHFLQVVLGESWVTFDAIFKITLLQTEDKSYSINQHATHKPYN